MEPIFSSISSLLSLFCCSQIPILLCDKIFARHHLLNITKLQPRFVKQHKAVTVMQQLEKNAHLFRDCNIHLQGNDH
jgi:hypothetical protein